MGLSAKTRKKPGPATTVIKSIVDTLITKPAEALKGENLKKTAIAARNALKTTWGTLKGDRASVEDFNEGARAYGNALAAPGVRIAQTATALAHPIQFADDVSRELSEDEIAHIIAAATGPTAAVSIIFVGVGADMPAVELPTVSGRIPAATATATKRAYNITTAGLTVEEAAAIRAYARRTNAWLAEAGPQTIQSTQGELRGLANAAARRERLRAARAGRAYEGQAGHVPDTAISGLPEPPGGWLDMPGVSNQCCGGGLSSRIGQTIDIVTVDGAVP